MDPIAFGMILGMIYTTLFLATMEAMRRKYRWLERLEDWIEKNLPDE